LCWTLTKRRSRIGLRTVLMAGRGSRPVHAISSTDRAVSARGRRRPHRRRFGRHSTSQTARRRCTSRSFFITGRPADLRDATERNLRQEGYHPTGVILLPEGATFNSAVDFKAPERRKIAALGYTIVLNMGDQESDLHGGYAEKTFKLPNPMYFLP
jgi:hypothetical protein